MNQVSIRSQLVTPPIDGVPRIKVMRTEVMIFRRQGYQNKTQITSQVHQPSHPENLYNIKYYRHDKSTDGDLN